MEQRVDSTRYTAYSVVLFYRYVPISDTDAQKEAFLHMCTELELLGRILVAREGINGTLAGAPERVQAFIDRMMEDERFRKIDWKLSHEQSPVADVGLALPFGDLSIKIVKEIVSSGQDGDIINRHIKFSNDTFGGIEGTGTHLTPSEFHEAVSQKKGLLLDVRNEFEHAIGHFDGSVDLRTFTYAETWKSFDRILADKGPDTESPIYMYCTGGIRCEKASAYLCAKGYENVYQLQGGIHRYLEEYPDGGLFHGKNFVFDSRVTVTEETTGSACATGAKSQSQTQKEQQENCRREEREDSSDRSSSPSSSAAGSTIIDLESQTSSKSAVGGLVKRKTIVGKCLDCAAPYDIYNGRVMCTVCRIPVLVCPACVSSNPHPSEYYCSRHRDLKGLYFTLLEPFSLDELRQQLATMRRLEVDLLADKDKGKKRRQTLRKQQNKIQERIILLEKRHRDVSKEEDVGVEKSSCMTESGPVDKEHHEYGHVIDDIVGKAVDVDDNDSEGNKRDLDTNMNDHVAMAHSLNPQTRADWGFWKAPQAKSH